MKSPIFACLGLTVAIALAQDRCDAPYPNVYCNTTEILGYQSSSCTAYHVFVARGSDEPYPGRLGNLTREICSEIGKKDCGFESIQYPARSTAWGKDEWCKSASKGQANGQAQMKSYSQKCPDAKLILLGFSQGAAVAQDILGGGGGKVFECEQPDSPALDPTSAPGSKVIAAATFGSVIRSRNQNFTLAGGVDYDGQRARTPSQLEALNKYSDRLRDYCHYGDPMCAVGSTPANVYVHLDYFLERNQEVVQWIVGKAKSSSSNNNNNNNNNNINGQVSNGSTPSTSIFPSDTPTPSSIMPTQTSTAIQSTTSSQPNASSFTNTLFQSSSSSVLAKPAIATSTAASLPTGSQSPTGSGSTGAASSMVSSCFLVSLLSALTAVLV